MSEQVKKSTVGSPIWVETIATPEEYKEAAKKFPSMFTNGSKAQQFNPNYHEGGKWRYNMGAGLTELEIKTFNSNLEKLRELLKTKKFQHRPEYGPHAEAKP